MTFSTLLSKGYCRIFQSRWWSTWKRRCANCGKLSDLIVVLVEKKYLWMERWRIWLNPGKAWFLYHRRNRSKAVLLCLSDYDHMHTISNDRCDNGLMTWKEQREVKERSLSSKLSTFSSDRDYCIESRCKSKMPPLLIIMVRIYQLIIFKHWRHSLSFCVCCHWNKTVL